jgi:hypothetical protein
MASWLHANKVSYFAARAMLTAAEEQKLFERWQRSSKKLRLTGLNFPRL